MPRFVRLSVIRALIILTFVVVLAQPLAAAQNGTPAAARDHPFGGA